MTEEIVDRLDQAAASVTGRLSEPPELALILGSGLGALAERIKGVSIPYGEIAAFPRPTVTGHKGVLRIGRLPVKGAEKGPVAAVLSGRFHLYEGWADDDVVMPVLLAHRLGARTLIVTNAAGAVNRVLRPGDLVLIRDHVNLQGRNPLIGPVLREWGPRFPDMSEVYSGRLRAIAQNASDTRLPEGVYAAMTGPTYETPAEIRMLDALGVDLVGMSTVPEVIAARFLDMEVLGISCVTNMAAGILPQPLSHEEVVRVGREVAGRFQMLVAGILAAL